MIVIVLLVIMIPYLVVTLFMKDDEIKLEYGSNMVVRVRREATGNILEVPFEEYIVGVLAGEMPVSFEIEALKAQAVAARSYVLRKMQASEDQEYDVVDTVSNQVYLDDAYLREKWQDEYTEKINKIRTAVLETSGEYLEYDGKVAEAFFFSTSTGMTENSGEVFQTQLPYLTSVKSEWDQEVSPVFNDNVTLSLSDFYTKLGLPYQDNIQVEVTKTTSTGRVKEIKINDKTFTGSEVFSKLGLRSTFFTITQNGSNVSIDTKGYGHGVGMSQYGAQGMAKAGYRYDEILKHYYQGVEIKKI